MTWGRAALLAATLALGAQALPATAGHTDEVELTRTTTVVATTSGWLDVVLREDATLSAQVVDNPDVAISAPRDRLTRVALTRRPERGITYTYPDLRTERLPSLAGGRTRTWGDAASTEVCTTPGGAGSPAPATCTVEPAGSITLLQGRYRLSVLAPGSPVRVTLTLHGLDAGETVVRPLHRTRSLQRDLPLRASTDQVAVFGAAGLHGDVLAETWVAATYASTPGVRGHDLCSLRDDGTRTAWDYGPQCAQSDAGTGSYYVEAAGQRQRVISGATRSFGNQELPLGLGGSVTDTGGVTFTGALGIWSDPVPVG